MKLFSKSKPATPVVADDTAQSGVQLSRQALYERRMEEICEDAQAGRCSFEEAVDRVVEAAVARSTHWFTPRGHEELEARIRAACQHNPRLRKALGR